MFFEKTYNNRNISQLFSYLFLSKPKRLTFFVSRNLVFSALRVMFASSLLISF